MSESPIGEPGREDRLGAGSSEESKSLDSFPTAAAMTTGVYADDSAADNESSGESTPDVEDFDG